MATVGIIGLGIMGSAYAKNLIAGGVGVEGGLFGAKPADGLAMARM